MFDEFCEQCGIRPHKHNYLHFLEAVVMLKHKSSDIYISDLKSLFMKLVNHFDDTEETTVINEEWETVDFMGHHRLLISLLLTVMRQHNRLSRAQPKTNYKFKKGEIL